MDLTVRCTAQIDGSLTDCEVRDDEDQSPGRSVVAAVRMAVSSARLSPGAVNGVPEARPVTFTIRLRNSPARSGSEILPVWSEAPTTAQIAAARPAALGDRIGSAIAVCGLTEDGRPTRCDIEYESPRGSGTGEAFKALLPLFRTQSVLPEGVTRRQIYVRINLTMPNAESIEDGTEITRPNWMITPTQAEMSALFPEKARAASIPRGQATVTCEVQEGGGLGACQAIGAEPANAGFEEAGVSMAQLFAVSPWNAEGSPSTGRTVRLPFTFVDPNPR